MKKKLLEKSLILVGMPGAGKSTVGVMLAKELAKDFIDTDLLIQLRAGKTLQDIIDEQGYQALRQIEEATLVDHEFFNHIVATGGSAVYSEKGMKHLKTFGKVVYLHADLDELNRRIHNYEDRGIARKPGQSFEDLFNERKALYEHYADISVDGSKMSQQEVLIEIIEKI